MFEPTPRNGAAGSPAEVALPPNVQNPLPPPERVLVLSPHTDDAELGAGGTIARWLREGAEVHVATFSTAEQSLPDGLPSDTLRLEFQASMQTLGVPAQNLYIHDYPVRMLSYHRQEVLEELIHLRNRIRPNTVLAPSTHDVHQDHQTLAQEAVRAFRGTTMLGYELPWNHLSFDTDLFVKLEEIDITRKVEALKCYRSQIAMNRPYFSDRFAWSLAEVRGVQSGNAFAEAFQVLRMMI